MKNNLWIVPIALLTALVLVITLLTGTVFFRVMSQPTTDSAASFETVSLTEEDTSQTAEEPTTDEETESVLPAEASSSAEIETDLAAPEQEPESSASAPAEEAPAFAPVSGGVPASPNASADDPYPGLYAESAEFTDDKTQKIIYLTFNSSPSDNTDRLLSILSDHNVKATFFVNGKNGTAEERGEYYRKILQSGHTLGLHSYTYDYKKIYASIDTALSDLNQINEEVYAATGYQANLVRFPGGSANKYNSNFCKRLTDEVTRRGYTYHDWSVSGDSEKKNLSAEDVIQKVEDECASQNKSVVLLHDLPTQTATAEALDRIIDDLEAQGYEFRALDNTVKPFHFDM